MTALMVISSQSCNLSASLVNTSSTICLAVSIQLSYEHNPSLILFEIISFVIYAATYKTIHDGMVFRSIVAFGNIFFFSLICYYHNFYFHFRCIYVLHLLLLHVSLLVYVSAFRSECYFYRRITCGTQTHLHNVTVFSLCHF